MRGVRQQPVRPDARRHGVRRRHRAGLRRAAVQLDADGRGGPGAAAELLAARRVHPALVRELQGHRQPAGRPRRLRPVLLHGAERSQAAGQRRIHGGRGVRPQPGEVRTGLQPGGGGLQLRRPERGPQLHQRHHQRALPERVHVVGRLRHGDDHGRRVLRRRFAGGPAALPRHAGLRRSDAVQDAGHAAAAAGFPDQRQLPGPVDRAHPGELPGFELRRHSVAGPQPVRRLRVRAVAGPVL